MTLSSLKRSAALAMAGALALVLSAELHGEAPQQPGSGAVAATRSPQRLLLNRYCVTCHNERLTTAGLALDVLGRRRRGGPVPRCGKRWCASSGPA